MIRITASGFSPHSPYLGQAREALTASPVVVFSRKNSVMKPTERTTCLYKNSLHLALAPVVGSLQTGAGLQAWSEEAAILAPQNMKPIGRFRSRPIICAGAVA